MSIASRRSRSSHSLVWLAAALALCSAPACAADETSTALQKRCDGGDAAACSDLAWRYQEGETVAKDVKRAAALYRRSCDLKHGDGCVNLAWMYMDGIGVAKDEQEYERLKALGCKLGTTDRERCFTDDQFAEMMAFSSVAAQYEELCTQGNAAACYEAGVLWYDGSDLKAVLPARFRSAGLFKKGCDGGSPASCSMLGYQHELGISVAEDKPLAATLYAKACRPELPKACTNLGYMHVNGESVAKDPTKAAALFIVACDADDAEACHGLSLLYMKGEGVQKNDAKAVELLQTSCAGNHAAACTGLGYRYLFADGLPKDPRKAAEHFEKACTADDGWGCHALGLMHETNEGGAMDPAKAAALHAKACKLGHKESCDRQAQKTAAAATPAKAPATKPAAAKPATAACKIVKMQLGVDTVASVERDIQARGGSASSGTGLGKHRLSAMSGDYRDAGSDVMAVNYDFDAAGPAGRLIAVTISRKVDFGAPYAKLAADRKAALTKIFGALKSKSATEHTGSTAGCTLTLYENPDGGWLYEVYRLPN